MLRKLLEHMELFPAANIPRIPLVTSAINTLMMLTVTKTSTNVKARLRNAGSRNERVKKTCATHAAWEHSRRIKARAIYVLLLNLHIAHHQ